MMSGSRAAMLLGLVLVLGACTGTPEPAVRTREAVPVTATGATSTTALPGDAGTGNIPPPGTPRPPPGELRVEVFNRPSQVTTALLEVGQSSVEVQIAAILSEFDTTRTDLGSVVTLSEQVLFDFDSAVLKPEAAPALDRIAEALALAEQRRVTVRGHTDSRGDDAYNLDLSQQRALAVLDYFVTVRGLSVTRFEAVGLGETEPVAANEGPGGVDDPAGRQLNRRVEIILADA